MTINHKKIVISLAVFLFASLVASVPFVAAIQNELAIITAEDGVTNDTFGAVVSVSGNYAIIAGLGDDDNGAEAGAAYIYHRLGVTWIMQAKLHASDGITWDTFGESVSISGDYAVIGAPFDDDMGLDSGSIYIFYRTGSTWSEVKKLYASDVGTNAWFGRSVAISGNYIVVGARYDVNGTGAAYIFERDPNGNSASWDTGRRLYPNDPLGSDEWFGHDVSISGDTAIIGSLKHEGSWHVGAAYVFERNQGGSVNWGQQAKLLASDGEYNDAFVQVSIDGDYVIVGAYQDTSAGSLSGSAYIFHRVGTTWTEEQKLVASDAATVNYFGGSVSISGEYAVVGARGADSFKGKSYMFHRVCDSWEEVDKLYASDGSINDHFGGSVSVSGDDIFIGALHKNSSQGSVYVFSTQPPISYIILDPPLGPGNNNANDINDSGVIVGNYYDGTYHGYLYDGNTYTSIDVPGSSFTRANGINKFGHIVGADNDSGEAFLYQDGIYTTFAVPGASKTVAYGINDLGQIVGDYVDTKYHGFLYSVGTGTFTTIDVPKSEGAALGNYNGTSALDINDLGQILGYYASVDDGSNAFIYDISSASFTTFDAFDKSGSTGAIGINDSGQIVGSFSCDKWHGFLKNGNIYTDLIFPGTSVPANAYGINNLGQFVGRFDSSTGYVRGFLAIPNANPPIANAGIDQSVYIGDTVALDGIGSSDPDSNLITITYRWMLTSKPIGSTVELSDPALVNPTFIVDKPGTYIVALVVNDGYFNSLVDSVTITATNTAPTATITAPADGATFIEGEQIDFAGSGSDPEEGALTGTSLEWSSNIDGILGTGSPFPWSNLSVGTHTITLTATDIGGLTGTDTITVIIEPAVVDTDGDGVANDIDQCPDTPVGAGVDDIGCAINQIPKGTNVPISPVDGLTLTFDKVDNPGTVDAEPSGTGTPPPQGFKLGTPPTYYNITLDPPDGVFTGNVQVCITYDKDAYTNPDKVKLFHKISGGNWADVTIGGYPQEVIPPTTPVTYVVCGTVDSFSEFALFEEDPDAVINIDIDIKPGSDTNAIKLQETGNIPVAIFGSGTFNVSTIDVESLRLNAAAVWINNGQKTMYSFDDINSDGITDMMAHFDRGQFIPIEGDEHNALLTGNTSGGTNFVGSDSIKLIDMSKNNTSGSDLDPDDDSPTVPLSSDLEIHFNKVKTTGNTSFTLSFTSSVKLPHRFTFGKNPKFYDLNTTAGFTSAEVCITYDETEYSSEEMLKLLHYETGWDDVTTSLDTSTNTVCGTVSSFSPFVVGQKVAGTAVSLSSFTAAPKENSGGVLISWRTGSEINNEGFNILRSDSPEGGFVKVNTGLIMARGSLGGASYQFTDSSANPGSDYFYRLEDIDNFGNVTVSYLLASTGRRAEVIPASLPGQTMSTIDNNTAANLPEQKSVSPPAPSFSYFNYIEGKPEDGARQDGESDLLSFTLLNTKDGMVIKWSAADKGISGFNILKAEYEDGLYLQVNDTLIEPLGDGEGMSSYSYVDKASGGHFYYRIEVIKE